MNVAAAGRVGDVELLISGPAGRAAAQELADWWQAEAGVTLSVQDRVDAAAPGERSDGWAITATVIAIPAAILAADDLAQRLQLKARLERLLTKARELSRQGHRVQLKTRNQRVIELDGTDITTLFNALDDANDTKLS